MEAELRHALNPVAWAHDCNLLGYDLQGNSRRLDPWQQAVLRSDSKRLLLNCSRQSGKSLVMGLMALHRAIFYPGSLVLLVSITQRQSGELLHTILGRYGLSPSVPSEGESAQKLELANGSRILSLPGTQRSIRGYSGANLLIFDEAAQIEDEVYYSVTPMLAVSGGSLICASTPWGSRGWWYNAWVGPENWHRTTITADQCPRISAEFLAEEKRTRGSFWIDQEYFCIFGDSQNQAFRQADLDMMFSEPVEAWDLYPELEGRTYSAPEPKKVV